MEREDWTLLAIASAGGQAVTPVQLQKILFLLGSKLPDAVGREFYQFEPYNYGPFDVTVYRDAEALAARGLVATQAAPGQRWTSYAATPAGLRRAEQVRRGANTDAVAYLSKVVAWARALSFSDLVKAIYREYPAFRARSIFGG